MKDYRKAMIAKIHIARKELNLTELQYRDILKKLTGKTSTKYMTSAELHRVLAAFYQMGFKPKKKKSIPAMVSDSKQGMIARIEQAAPQILGIKWHRRLRRFIEYKYEKSELQFLTLNELRGVWAFLRAVERKR